MQRPGPTESGSWAASESRAAAGKCGDCGTGVRLCGLRPVLCRARNSAGQPPIVEGGGCSAPPRSGPPANHTLHTPLQSPGCRHCAGQRLGASCAAPGLTSRHGRRRQGAAQGWLGAGAEEEETPSVLWPAHLHWEAGSHRSEAVDSACASGGATAGLSGRHSCGICRAAHLTLHSDRCVGRSMLCGWPWLRAGGCGEAHECEVTGLAALLAGLFQCGFKRLTEIQKVAIPHALAG